MQPWRIALALTLAIVPLGARGQEPTQPASLEEPCSVSADPSWTPQEKFVWERVCAGEDADFNAAPGYGGQLDPTKPEGWPQNRVLRPKFLETILFKDPYRSALTRNGVNIVGARFTETINLENAELEHPFGLQDSLLEKDVNLIRVRSKSPMGLARSHVAGTLDMYELELSGDLIIQNANLGYVRLQLAHVGVLDLSGSKVTGTLDMSSVQVGGGLFMRDKDEFADVVLRATHVGGQLSLNGSKVTGKLKMSGLQVVSGLFMRDKAEFADVDLTGVHVSGQLVLNGSKVAGYFNCYGLDVEQQVFMGAEFDGRVDCVIVKIKGDLYLYGQFKKDVDFSGADIDGGLHLQSAQWADGVTLVLRDAKVLGTIPGLADAWAPKLDLDGFTYRSAGAADQFENWFGRLDHYAPQPYEQLASVIQSQGHGALATAIRYSSRERERSEATDGAWVWLTTLKWLIGYGYYPYYAMGWAIGLVIVGALVLRISRDGPPDIISYSFDMLLPIIRLRESHYQVDLTTWARYYFYFHKIMGYVLASFLLAGLAGLTK